MISISRFLLLTGLGSLLVLGSGLLNIACAELKVEGRPKWGLDDTIRVEEFNLLTVDLFNDSPNPWQGAVSAQPLLGFLPVDVRVVQPNLFIEPYGLRRLQFWLYTPNPTEYRIEWGVMNRGRLRVQGSFEVDTPTVAREAIRVRLVPDDAIARSPGIVSLRSEDFPASAAVLRGVDSIILDHVPRWQNPQTQAFRDWLSGGGSLLLLPDRGGAFPQFSSTLSELNEPSEEFPFGYGRVVRTVEIPALDKPAEEDDLKRVNRYNNLSSSGSLFPMLRTMTTPEHNWSLIACLTIIYTFLLFPGCWLLGRKRADYRLTYAAVLGIVSLFSYGMHEIGKRGYGEETAINSVAIVRPGQPGRWQVKQWSNLFMTTGGITVYEPPFDTRAISTGQHSEGVSGLAFNQPDGILQTDLPAFSNRSLVNIGVLKADFPRPQISNIQVQNDPDPLLTSLEFSLPSGISTHNLQGHVLYGGKFYTLRITENRLTGIMSPIPIAGYLNYNTLRFYNQGWTTAGNRTPEQTYELAKWILMMDDLGEFNDNALTEYRQPVDRLKLYLYQEMPPEFFPENSAPANQHGRVLFVFDYHLSEANVQSSVPDVTD